MVPFIVSGSTLTVFIKGKPKSVSTSHPHYAKIKAGLKTLTEKEIDGLVDIPAELARSLVDHKLTIDQGKVLLDGKVIKNVMATRLLTFLDEGFPIDAFTKFIESIYKNPADHAIEELYLFLEANNLPITENGGFLTYKRVRKDYTDSHTGKFINKPGEVISMPREKVDPKRDNECSTGFHVCSFSYLKSFSGERTVICEVMPQDVVSVPKDYNNAKMRVCKYKVVGEVDNNEINKGKEQVKDHHAETKDYDTQETSAPEVTANLPSGLPENKKASRVWVALYTLAEEKTKTVAALMANKLAVYNTARALCKRLEIDPAILAGQSMATVEDLERVLNPALK